MDRTPILKKLEQARRHASEGARQIARQKRILATLKLAGKDSRMAANLLETMEALQALAEKRCVRMERQLAALDEAAAAEKKRVREVS